MAKDHSQDKQPTTTDGCFILNPEVDKGQLVDGISLRLHQIRAIAVLSTGGDDLREDLADAVLLNVNWLAADCNTLVGELARRMSGVPHA